MRNARVFFHVLPDHLATRYDRIHLLAERSSGLVHSECTGRTPNIIPASCTTVAGRGANITRLMANVGDLVPVHSESRQCDNTTRVRTAQKVFDGFVYIVIMNEYVYCTRLEWFVGLCFVEDSLRSSNLNIGNV